ncbi:uncharacterized protein [Triticum aestivum]|uniref:uncharacterized protein n=1 Tax=Triticum aestivum TaxID=4565 RepID=UPI001D001AA2|nr:uncharacterized protein LOC123158019 [Triticum aestivum]
MVVVDAVVVDAGSKLGMALPDQAPGLVMPLKMKTEVATVQTCTRASNRNHPVAAPAEEEVPSRRRGCCRRREEGMLRSGSGWQGCRRARTTASRLGASPAPSGPPRSVPLQFSHSA